MNPQDTMTIDFMMWIFENHVLEILCTASGFLALIVVFSLIHPRDLIQNMGLFGRFIAKTFYGKTPEDYIQEEKP